MATRAFKGLFAFFAWARDRAMAFLPTCPSLLCQTLNGWNWVLELRLLLAFP